MVYYEVVVHMCAHVYAYSLDIPSWIMQTCAHIHAHSFTKSSDYTVVSAWMLNMCCKCVPICMHLRLRYLAEDVAKHVRLGFLEVETPSRIFGEVENSAGFRRRAVQIPLRNRH